MSNRVFNTANVINIAHDEVFNNAAQAWDIVVRAYGNVWAFHVEHMTTEIMLAITKASVKSGKIILRGLINSGTANACKYFEILKGIADSYDRICSIEEFEALYTWAHATHKRNRGEVAEQIMRDFYGLDMYWYKDSTPGHVAGDMVVNGTHIQCKFQNATFAHE